MFICENVTKIFDETPIFANFGIGLIPGSLILLKGPNGCGKTSLLRIMAGLAKPSTGSVTLGGISIHDDPSVTPNNIQYVGTKLGLKENLSCIDNLLFYTNLYETELMLEAACNYMDIGQLLDYQVHRLSTGQKKRVALAKLMLTQTTIWLLDEPDSNLDDDGKIRLKNLIESKVNSGGIVILASHNMSFGKLPCEVYITDYKVNTNV